MELNNSTMHGKSGLLWLGRATMHSTLCRYLNTIGTGISALINLKVSDTMTSCPHHWDIEPGTRANQHWHMSQLRSGTKAFANHIVIDNVFSKQPKTFFYDETAAQAQDRADLQAAIDLTRELYEGIDNGHAYQAPARTCGIPEIFGRCPAKQRR